jgi:hypothetical protein
MDTENNTNLVQLSPLEIMLNSAKTWKKPTPKPKGKTSKFTQFIDVIRYLRSYRHMSYDDITLFFNENGLKCTYSGLLNFVKKNRIGGYSATKKVAKKKVDTMTFTTIPSDQVTA